MILFWEGLQKWNFVFIVGIGATVSPGNPYSLNNAKASGFEIVSRWEMYGGHDRYLLAKHL